MAGLRLISAVQHAAYAATAVLQHGYLEGKYYLPHGSQTMHTHGQEVRVISAMAHAA